MLFFVGEKFNEFIEDFFLYFVDECGYVLMMEYFEIFNNIFEDFFEKY